MAAEAKIRSHLNTLLPWLTERRERKASLKWETKVMVCSILRLKVMLSQQLTARRPLEFFRTPGLCPGLWEVARGQDEFINQEVQ